MPFFLKERFYIIKETLSRKLGGIPSSPARLIEAGLGLFYREEEVASGNEKKAAS